MELNPKQQIFEVIKKSKKLLLVTREHPSEDGISALLALGLFMEKNGKDVDMITSGPIPRVLEFLPNNEGIKKEIIGNKNFKISLDASDNEIAQFSYDFDKDEKKLNIFITPKAGSFSDDHVTTEMLGFGYDTIIVLNSSDFEKLGDIYTKNTDLFYETAVLNIDHQNANEQYGEVNLVNGAASSTSELVYEILELFGDQAIDENIAKCLLAGIIAATKSFQNNKSTPQALTIAAKLVALGANQQDIINNLYKNKSLASLKLWGRALARVQHSPEHKIAWSMISQKDFLNSGADLDDLEGIVDEIMSSVSGTDITFLVYELSKKNKIASAEDVQKGSAGDIAKGEIGVIIKTQRSKEAEDIAKNFDIISKNGVMKIKVPDGNLLEVEKSVLGKIKGMKSV